MGSPFSTNSIYVGGLTIIANAILAAHTSSDVWACIRYEARGGSLGARADANEAFALLNGALFSAYVVDGDISDEILEGLKAYAAEYLGEVVS